MQGSFAAFFNKLYLFMIGAAVVLAIVVIIWGGFEYALSEAITSKTAGRQKIVQALFGLAIVLSPALVFSIINPAILKLNVNFPALQTPWGRPSPPPGNTGGDGGTPGPAANSRVYTCSGGECANAIQACKDYASANKGILGVSTAYFPAKCQKSDGTFDPNGRTDYFFLPGVSCVDNETPVIDCEIGSL